MARQALRVYGKKAELQVGSTMALLGSMTCFVEVSMKHFRLETCWNCEKKLLKNWPDSPTGFGTPLQPRDGGRRRSGNDTHGQWVTPAFFKLPGRWSSIMSRTGKTGGILDTMSPKWDSIWNLQYWGSLNNYALSAPWIFANQPGWRGTCFFQCSCFKLLRQMCRPAADRWGALWSGVVWSQGPGTWNDMLSNAGFLK